LSPGRDFETRLFAKKNAAELLSKRFKLACQTHGISNERVPLRTDLFVQPVKTPPTPQLALF
jgi:hypothetical protein